MVTSARTSAGVTARTCARIRSATRIWVLIGNDARSHACARAARNAGFFGCIASPNGGDDERWTDRDSLRSAEVRFPEWANVEFGF